MSKGSLLVVGVVVVVLAGLLSVSIAFKSGVKAERAMNNASAPAAQKYMKKGPDAVEIDRVPNSGGDVSSSVMIRDNKAVSSVTVR